MRKWLLTVLLTIILLPILVVALWYGISFLPHLSELTHISKQGDLIVSSACGTLYTIAVAGESKEGIRRYAIRQAYWSLVYEKRPGRMLSWHLNNMLWYLSQAIFTFLISKYLPSGPTMLLMSEVMDWAMRHSTISKNHCRSSINEAMQP